MTQDEMDQALAATEELEQQLTTLQTERGLLEGELTRLDQSSAGTVGMRRRRRLEVEERISQIVQLCSGLQQKLRHAYL